MANGQSEKEIYVYSHGEGMSDPVLMGTLSVSEVRGKEICSFTYEKDYLHLDAAFAMDPNLRLYEGPQYAPDTQSNFGIFLDSSPDRWGRVLMERREAVRAKAEDRPPARLMESDYLLGVHDASRMGALRFKTDPEGPFLDNDDRHATPPMTSLRALEHASLELEGDDDFNSEQYKRNLALLIAPGSSLGGARPKASVQDPDGRLWIAKFPSRNDDVDQGAWEYVIYQLACDCGITMAESQAEVYYSDCHTFLTKRFDRTDAGGRLHFFSAMTLLGYQDGADGSNGVSYLELVDLLMQRGSEPETDLRQLWRRIVFNICVSNTDDHLRNHGFMLRDGGLRLSPAYDINPEPRGHGLNLNIDEHNNALDLDLALSVAKYFRLNEEEAQAIIEEVKTSVGNWRSVARSLGISKREISQMAPAFRFAGE
jgi:serine/threonine-protein kinase HipA